MTRNYNTNENSGGLTKSSARGVRRTLLNPLCSKKSLTGSPGGFHEIQKMLILFHRNISPGLLGFVMKLISEHLVSKFSYALKMLIMLPPKIGSRLLVPGSHSSFLGAQLTPTPFRLYNL